MVAKLEETGSKLTSEDVAGDMRLDSIVDLKVDWAVLDNVDDKTGEDISFISCLEGICDGLRECFFETDEVDTEFVAE